MRGVSGQKMPIIITLAESWVFTAANETKGKETNARVLCSSTTWESKLGMTSTTSSAGV